MLIVLLLKMLWSNILISDPTIVAAGSGQTAEKIVTAKPAESSSPPAPATGIEDLFKDTPNLTTQQAPKDVKGDIMSLFEKVNY